MNTKTYSTNANCTSNKVYSVDNYYPSSSRHYYLLVVECLNSPVLVVLLPLLLCKKIKKRIIIKNKEKIDYMLLILAKRLIY